LDRRHDLGASSEMEDARNPSCGGGSRRPVSNIAMHDLQAGIFTVLREVGLSAHDEIIEHTDRAALRKQRIDKVATDKSGTACYKIDLQV